MNIPSGYGLMVYDSDPERRSVFCGGRDIMMVVADFEGLESFVEDGMRFVKLSGTRWDYLCR